MSMSTGVEKKYAMLTESFSKASEPLVAVLEDAQRVDVEVELQAPWADSSELLNDEAAASLFNART
jgi:hypothetical protein